MALLKAPRLVLDASAVVRIIEGSPQAAAFQQAVLDAELVLAPELMLTEVSNALWRLQRAGQLQAESLQQCLSRAAALVDHIEPDRHLQVEALALACHLDHPVYDCLYLALARREAAILLTADQRLQRLAATVLP
ncbi:type II toxin-antitoxin system VapC family toxin [Synechococcus sp. LA31]|uniref:type II toxin-antitoxin system VapC family toxin n=1 Tax=Synechococcus sp. LA31 TaxID=2741953 RepID=UPI001BDBE1EC|nr:type II toxin-antitoxin system VapC family toxin [Synechococcus sp. LA31]QVV68754.1 type II toxin-antitoxin system VapC family toxin [Synechococcus sp. LA31]